MVVGGVVGEVVVGAVVDVVVVVFGLDDVTFSTGAVVVDVTAVVVVDRFAASSVNLTSTADKTSGSSSSAENSSDRVVVVARNPDDLTSPTIR
jgi:hypothetical protein